MALFLGTFEGKLDSKGRLTIPADFRAALAHENSHATPSLPPQQLVAHAPSNYPALDCCSMAQLLHLSAAIDASQLGVAATETLNHELFAAARSLGLDDTGRLVLPEPFLRAARLQPTAMILFVGCRTTFQIWDSATYQTYLATRRQQGGSAGEFSLATLGARLRGGAA